MPIATLKSSVACAVRLLTAEGLMDMNGHVSVRPAGADHVLINSRDAGRQGVRDIVTVDLNGRPLPGERDPPAETRRSCRSSNLAPCSSWRASRSTTILT